jgi:predicted transcriptional regulator YheO
VVNQLTEIVLRKTESGGNKIIKRKENKSSGQSVRDKVFLKKTDMVPRESSKEKAKAQNPEVNKKSPGKIHSILPMRIYIVPLLTMG